MLWRRTQFFLTSQDPSKMIDTETGESSSSGMSFTTFSSPAFMPPLPKTRDHNHLGAKDLYILL